MTVSDPTPAPTSDTRPRYQRRPKSLWQRVPVSVWVLLVAGAVYAGYLGWADQAANRATITFLPPGGGVVPSLRLTFYPMGEMLASPSPMRPTGERELHGADTVTVDRDLLVSDATLVRFEGDGIGAGSLTLRPGTDATVQLAAPHSLRGRAACWRPSLSFGSLPLTPLAGARVIAMGGGARGVPLAEAVSDADGWFTVEGLDAGMSSVGLRLCDDGYAIDNFDVPLYVPESDSPYPVWQGLLVTVPTRPLRGMVVLPPGVRPADLRLVAHSLPGVDASIGADGSFVLDHVPPAERPKLLVYGLPPEWTHAGRRAAPGDDGVRIEVVPATTISGWVLDANTRQPIGGADVWHEGGPIGMVGVTTNPDGTFTIGEVPPGKLRLSAQHRGHVPGGDTALLRSGHRDLDIEAGVPRQQVIITVD